MWYKLPRTCNISISGIITVLTTLYLFILTLRTNTFIAILYSEDLKEVGMPVLTISLFLTPQEFQNHL